MSDTSQGNCPDTAVDPNVTLRLRLVLRPHLSGLSRVSKPSEIELVTSGDVLGLWTLVVKGVVLSVVSILVLLVGALGASVTGVRFVCIPIALLGNSVVGFTLVVSSLGFILMVLLGTCVVFITFGVTVGVTVVLCFDASVTLTLGVAPSLTRLLLALFSDGKILLSTIFDTFKSQQTFGRDLSKPH